MILIFMVLGARAVISFCIAVISFCILSAIPGYMVVPPERTLLAYRSLRMSISHFMMELYVVSWIPADYIPINDGLKKCFWATESLVTNSDNLTIGKFVAFLKRG
uniref:Protein N-terminal glutamine amidohydrolase-like n=1 Tax=Phallusia mammillata TaxID=59560 RepID=A0A6F9DWE5_9ASCI|nr:protein N-terminal glutamine amidohydrolase-like [Phallusia mammillata]